MLSPDLLIRGLAHEKMQKYLLFLGTCTLLCLVGCRRIEEKKNDETSAPPANQSGPASSNVLPSMAAPLTVKFESADNVIILGTFFATANKNSPAVLMLHQFGSDRGAYKALADEFRAAGISVLAIDGRGFGDSTSRTDGTGIVVSRSNEAVNGMIADVGAALKWMREQKSIDPRRIGILGASYGSSLAIIYSSRDPEIRSVALLSPGINYFGTLPTEPAVEKYAQRPLLLVASESDKESAQAARDLDKLVAGERHQLQIYSKGGHGTQMLASGLGLQKLFLEFFQRTL